MLKKTDCIFARKEGLLIPQSVELLEPVNGKIETISLIPLTRAELRELFSGLDKDGKTTKDADSMLISEKVKNPSFSYEEANDIPLDLTNNIINTLLFISGVKRDLAVKSDRRDSLKKTEDEFSKNSEKPSS